MLPAARAIAAQIPLSDVATLNCISPDGYFLTRIWAARKAINLALVWWADQMSFARAPEFDSLVQLIKLSIGNLSLQKLSRVAISRAINGGNFAIAAQLRSAVYSSNIQPILKLYAYRDETNVQQHSVGALGNSLRFGRPSKTNDFRHSSWKFYNLDICFT